MIRLYAYVGEVSEDQLDFLIDNLEEEWGDDQEYFLNKEMIEMLQQKGAEPELIETLKQALGDKEDVDVVWIDTEEIDEEDEDDEDDV